jgi:hypothetical protein
MNQPITLMDCIVTYKVLKCIVESHRMRAIRHPEMYAPGGHFHGVLQAHEETLRMMEGREPETEKSA